MSGYLVPKSESHNCSTDKVRPALYPAVSERVSGNSRGPNDMLPNSLTPCSHTASCSKLSIWSEPCAQRFGRTESDDAAQPMRYSVPLYCRTLQSSLYNWSSSLSFRTVCLRSSRSATVPNFAASSNARNICLRLTAAKIRRIRLVAGTSMFL